MHTPFYQYPIRATRLMQARPPGQLTGDHPTCELGRSVAQLLYLLLHTRPGQLRSAPDFGCAVWELEFISNVELAHWEGTLTKSLLRAVQHYEPRLRDVRVRVALSATAPPQGQAADLPARWYAQVTITGVLTLTHEPFSFSTQLHIGQLSA